MREFHKLSLLTRLCVCGCVASLLLAACSGAGDEQTPQAPGTALESAAPAAVDGEPTDKAGCTYIQYCDYPKSWVGTRCIWSACNDFCTAVRECIKDTKAVCGSAKADWTIYTSAGDILMSDARAYCGV